MKILEKPQQNRENLEGKGDYRGLGFRKGAKRVKSSKRSNLFILAPKELVLTEGELITHTHAREEDFQNASL